MIDDYFIVLLLLTLSALFSGLTLGLMSLSAQELRRKMSLGNKAAKKVYEIRRRGNLLLTTLLIGNVAVNSALAVYLGSLASGVVAGFVATALIVVFGEITPQAIFSRYALSLGAKMAWLVRIFIFVLYPIAAPIAWLLNKVLGEELTTVYSKKELMKIVEEHKLDDKSDVDHEEAQIIQGALTFSHKKVVDVMTPKNAMHMVSSDVVVDDTLLHKLAEEGFMRVPIYESEMNNIIGVVHLSTLMKKGVEGKNIGSFANKKPHFVSPEDPLDETFLKFIKFHRHMFIVKDKTEVVGVITLEDVLEEIIQEEILDENDAS